ncbi:2-polyprenylphenol 6-hydroxylase [Ketobacter alkanivorans]|uniref:2-polyprenylphenol 6-hydroxylase n=1 Tax=Ketobacter alkanivorans TaxID=1917421 RepID=A0A2K9LN77_9GAMM|nr:2-polyprenylphenol 6-hydroxylase [Ketobacter alkanivorans]AUM12244.1 2-polyprenylphenol 6-hydroxylase [Ketobacter alkanivorans]MCP5014781.1 2-polyprenylphenol 6-hydroxylase [Ketobacter sp.]
MKRLARLLTIFTMLARYRLDQLLPDHAATRPLKWLIRLHPAAWGASTASHPWARARIAMEELGPVFIKFGQLLSTRHDLLPEEAIEDLSNLQDNVPPFGEQAAFDIIERELKGSIQTLYGSLERTPLASASVAQVHAGTLLDGREIVVKVIRPGIEKLVDSDLALLLTGARWLEKLAPETKRFHPVQVVTDYRHILMGELDLGQEAANAAQFRRNFDASPLLYVPDIHWNLSTSKVLTMERVYGVPVSDTEAMIKAGVNMEHISEIGVEIFFTQVFRDNFFHADMHPGNVLVNLKDPQNPQYLSLDCAIVGTLSKEERFLLARQLMALLDKDYEQIAILMVEAGWVPSHTRIHEFQNALRTVLEPVLERPLQEIEFGPVLIRLFQTARRFEMQALPQFVLLEKTLIHVEGLGRQLYPELDIWEIGRPLLENWIRDQIGPSAIAQTIKRNAPALIEQIPHIPKLAWDALQEMRKLSENQQKLLQQVEERHLGQIRRDRIITLLGLIGLTVGLSWGMNPDWLANWQQVPAGAWVSGAIGATLLLTRLRKSNDN